MGVMSHLLKLVSWVFSITNQCSASLLFHLLVANSSFTSHPSFSADQPRANNNNALSSSIGSSLRSAVQDQASPITDKRSSSHLMWIKNASRSHWLTDIYFDIHSWRTSFSFSNKNIRTKQRLDEEEVEMRFWSEVRQSADGHFHLPLLISKCDPIGVIRRQ